MITIFQNNEFVYTFLEKNAKLPSSFDRNQIFGFDDGDDFCLVVYISANRNFILFRAENYAHHTDVLPELMSLIQEFSTEQLSAEMQQESLQLVEDKLHSKNNFRFFFDAH